MRRTLTGAFILALALPGCAETQAPGRNDPVPPACEGQQFSLTVTDPPTAVLRLEYNQTGTVQFQYDDCTGQPLVGYQVNFITTGNTGGSVLQASSGSTDGSGLVTATVQSRDVQTDFQLVATALRAPEASAKISVRSKAGGDVEVRVIYRGRKNLNGAKVLVMTAPVDCATVDPASPPTAIEVVEIDNLRDKALFTLVGNPQVAVAVIGKGSTLALAAFGCDAGPHQVSDGKNVVVEVELKDIPPSYAGTYDVINNFNLVEILPDGIAFYIEQLGNLFQDPGGTVVDWLRNAPGVSDLPGASTVFTLAGDIIADLANDAFDKFTEGTAIGDAFSMGAEIDDILRKLEIESTITILEEPNEAGVFGPDAIEERWDALIINWTGGVCDGEDAAEGCGRNAFTWGGVETDLDPVNAKPTGSVDADDPFKLTIDPHGLKFDTGKIALFIIEKVVLPRLLGYDSFESFIFELLGGAECLGDDPRVDGELTDEAKETCCQAFSEGVFPNGGVSAGLAKGICKGGVGPVVTLVKGRVSTLEADSGDNMTLGTTNGDGSVNKPCVMFDEDADNQVEALGLPPAKRCEWQVEIAREGGEPVDFTGQWHGTRR